METVNEEPLPPILVYYRFRGQLQPIRNLYCYLELPFLEIHMDYFEEQKKELPTHILQHIRKFKIQSEQLPVLIHNDLVIEGQYPIAVVKIVTENIHGIVARIVIIAGSGVRARSGVDMFAGGGFAGPDQIVQAMHVRQTVTNMVVFIERQHLRL